MVLFEYEGKIILKDHHLPVLQSFVVDNAVAARNAAEKLNTKVVLKAQIMGGKRGKRGLIKVADTPENAELIAQEIFNRKDIPEAPITEIMIEPAVEIEKEYYIATMVDRSSKKILVMFSAEGGIEIEEVARQTPEAIEKLYLNFIDPIYPFKFFPMISQFGIEGKPKLLLSEIIMKLVQCSKEEDLILAEINPFIFTKSGEAWVLDAKIQIDEGAQYRHPIQKSFHSINKNLGYHELKAKDADLAYVQLSGDIGMISCGAGLSMATCDIIEKFGGKAANFLDVGGGASPQKVESALNILFSQTHIRGILINVFGGITRGEEVAKGIITALKLNPDHVPIVVRLIGTNDQEGVAMLAAAGIDAFTEMEPAVKRILEVLK